MGASITSPTPQPLPEMSGHNYACFYGKIERPISVSQHTYRSYHIIQNGALNNMTDLILLQDWYKTSIELWRPVAGFRGYEISNQGRLRSYWRISGTGRSYVGGQFRGSWTQIIGDTPRILKGGTDKDGYKICGLRRDGHTFGKRIHQLVASAFIFNARPGIATIPNHINNVKYDNRVENLNWMTIAENTLYGNEHGNGCRGIRHGMARLSEEDVLHIRATCRTYADALIAAKHYQCTPQNIDRIMKRLTWAHL